MNRIHATIILLFICALSVFAGDGKKQTDTTKVKEPLKVSWFYGGKIAFDTYKYNYTIAGNSYSQRINTFGISPKGGVFLGDKMLVGLALWYNTQVDGVPAFATTIKELEEYLKSVQNPKTTSNSFTVAPHFRYRLVAFWNNRLGIWGEARPFFTIDWVKSSIFTNTVRQYGCGFRIGPVITIDITPKFIFETSFDLLAIGWQGTYFKQNLEYDHQGVHHVLPVNYQDSNFGFSYGFNAKTLYNAIISVGIMKRF